MTTTPRRSAAAMSIIEIMVAITIIAIGLGSGLGAMGNAQTSSIRTQHTDRALSAIQDKIEDFEAYTYAELFVNQNDNTATGRFGSGDTLYFAVEGLSGPFIEGGVTQSDAMKVQKLAENGTLLKRVLIRFSVSWTDALGATTIEQFFHFTQRR